MTDKINIPPIVFKIVWPVLYTFLLLFIMNLYKQPSTSIRRNLIVAFWIGILLNISWILFYWKFKQKFLAFIDLILMIGIAIYILTLYPKKKRNSFYFYAYLIYTLWIIFALVITIANKNYKK